MVTTAIKGNKRHYFCGECNFAYKSKRWAQKCEEWCKKHHSCNTEITKYSIEV